MANLFLDILRTRDGLYDFRAKQLTEAMSHAVDRRSYCVDG
jgi:hypothetical protein